MEIRVIDDNKKFAEDLCIKLLEGNHRHCQPITIEGVDDAFTLSETIAASLTSESVLFMNTNLAIGKETRQSHQGLEVLTWLRIKGLMNHCVLYSFQSLDAIAKAKQNNLLLFSKGISFVRLPNDFSTMDLNRIKDDKAEKENLKSYLTSLFNASQFRHRNANWWSIKVLWDIHRVATGGNFVEPYPKHVTKNLSWINNAVGVYLHGLEVKDIVRFIGEKRERLCELQKARKDQKVETERDRQVKAEEVEIWEEAERDAQNGILAERQAQQYSQGDSYLKSRQQIATLHEEKSAARIEANDASRVCEEKQEELRLIDNEIKELESLLFRLDSTVKDELFDQVQLPKLNKSRILLIDDNAHNGWKDIFEEILDAEIESYTPPKKYIDDIDGLYEALKPKIIEIKNDKRPSIIFLDLRLFDETGRSINIENVSGRKLLKRIRTDFRGIPIVITTASNKLWTFQDLINLGADAYWVKEGLDELRDVDDSIRNYCRLLFLVDKLTDGRYKVLHELSDYAEKFERDKSTHWSKEVLWANGEKTNGRLDQISACLNDTFYLLKSYLHIYHLKYGFKDTLNEAFVLSGLINKIAGVYELVHGLDKNTYKNAITLRDERGDTNLEKLRVLRNLSSHAGGYPDVTWINLTETIDEAKNYL